MDISHSTRMGSDQSHELPCLMIERTTLKQTADGLPTILRQQNIYDLAGRLTRAYTRDGDGKTLSRLAYSYDDNANPTSRATLTATQRYTYDALDRLTGVA